MINHILKFKESDWDEPQKGLKQKVFSDGHTRLRLLQFDEDFVEDYWCLKGHVGFVVDGEMRIDFDGSLKHYQRGDGLWIGKGEAHKHKVIMTPGTMVELILFEELD